MEHSGGYSVQGGGLTPGGIAIRWRLTSVQLRGSMKHVGGPHQYSGGCSVQSHF